jgi:heavy metal translocating P-type ATPase
MSESAASEAANISLGGLWCSSCAWLISETLRRAPGVQDADVSFVQREARVTFDPDQTDPRRFLRQVRRLGYKAWLSSDAPPRDEEEAHFNRLLVGGVFAMHIMLISLMLYIREWLRGAPPETAWLADIFQYMLLALAVPAMLVLGIPILRAGIASLLHGRPNMHTLITIGAFSAFGLSIRNLILGLDGIYFDTAAMLLFLVTLGRWFEMQAQKASSEAVERLWKRIPEEASWLTPEGEKRVLLDQLPKGAKVLVRPGERFPIDGLVATGEGDVDESLLTGEPIPVTHGPGDRVLAGTVSMDGAFEIVTTAIGAETIAGQIGHLLHQALWERAPVERLADKLAAWMVPVALAIAGGTFAFWTARVGPEIGLLHALSVLLIACPCALGVATPLTLWIGLGRAAESGVILRGSSVLEHLAGVDHLFFDKTGTLTQRQFRLQAVAPNGLGEEAFLARVAAVETPSEHPLAQAVVESAHERDLTLEEVADFRVWPGQGVSGRLNGSTLWIGNQRLMAAHDLTIPIDMAATANSWREQGLCVIYAGWEGQTAGLLGLGENVRHEAVEVVRGLVDMEMDVTILTGDDAAAGERWARLLDIPVYAEQQPEDKIARLQSASGGVAMIGDGINDGPALAAALVGMTLGHGTDVARAAADVVLLNDDLRSVPWLVELARRTMKKVRQNLGWAFVYNLIGIGLAVTGYLQPVLAAIAMVVSNLIVTSNALRLRRIPLLNEQKTDP